MSKMNDKTKYLFDAAPAATLVAKGAAKTASADGAAFALDQVEGYWNDGELADNTIAVVVHVTALDTTTGDEAYEIDLEFGDDAAFTNATLTHTLAVSKAGQYVILVDVATVTRLLDGASHMRVNLTAAGTTPSITFHAWLGGAIL